MRAYLEALTRGGRVREVTREVNGRYELAAVTQASQAQNDAAILFPSRPRLALSGDDQPVWQPAAASRIDRRDRRIILSALVGTDDTPAQAPTIVSAPNDLEDIALTELPQITYFERDAGPYITAGVVLAREPDTGIANLSFHRCQIMSDKELRIRLGSSHHLTQYQAKAEARGEALEAAILLGPPPALVLAAAAPLAYDENEMEVAAKISRRAAQIAALPDCRSRCAGRYRDRDRGSHSARGPPAGGPVRRVHGLLRPGR